MFVDVARNDLMIMLNEVFTLIPQIMPVCISVLSVKVAIKWLKSEILGI